MLGIIIMIYFRNFVIIMGSEFMEIELKTIFKRFMEEYAFELANAITTGRSKDNY